MKKPLVFGMAVVVLAAASLVALRFASVADAFRGRALGCPTTNSTFIQSVCSLAGSPDWRSISVGQTDIGPSPRMYARFARAVAAGDTTICDDSNALLFLERGSRLSRDDAMVMCERYISQRVAAGWFEIADPATGDVVRVEIAK